MNHHDIRYEIDLHFNKASCPRDLWPNGRTWDWLLHQGFYGRLKAVPVADHRGWLDLLTLAKGIYEEMVK